MANGISVPVRDLGAPDIHFGLWLVGEGETVTEGDRVAELIIPGACVDLIAPASGTLRHFAATGDVLHVGASVGVVS